MKTFILIAVLWASSVAHGEDRCYDYSGSCDFRRTPALQAVASFMFRSTLNSEIIAATKKVGCWCQNAVDPEAPNQQWLTCPNYPLELILTGLYDLQNHVVQFIYCHCIKSQKCSSE